MIHFFSFVLFVFFVVRIVKVGGSGDIGQRHPSGALSSVACMELFASLFPVVLYSAIFWIGDPSQVRPISGVVCLHSAWCGATVYHDLRGFRSHLRYLIGMLIGYIVFLSRICGQVVEFHS